MQLLLGFVDATRAPLSMSSASTVGRERASRGQVHARADNDVPEHLKCSVCLDAPCGRIEQCANGEHNNAKRPIKTQALVGTHP